jgi:3-dehydroquinate synthase
MIINVKASKPYKIHLGNGLINEAKNILADFKFDKAFILTDEAVGALYFDALKGALKGIDVYSYTIKCGERHKNINTYLKITEAMSKARMTRGDLLIGLGGGVICDLAGFAAATYMRGLKLALFPTTFLAGIDAAIGGKNGVDTDFGKNMLGTIRQPDAVIYDISTLKTLSSEEIKNGIGEGIKYAVLDGGELFDILKAGLNDDNILRFCELSIRLKCRYVELDEEEKGLRRLLNLGHTAAHAIEKLSDYKIPHGAAVVKGLALIADASARAAKLGERERAEIFSLIEKYGFDTKVELSVSQLLEVIKSDKKGTGKNGITIADIVSIGDCRERYLDFGELGEYLS